MSKGKIKTFNLNLFIAIIVFIFTAAGNAAAATYYVSTTGSDSNSGLIGAPFRTIQKAANIVNPGDTVIVKNGVYTDTNGDNYVVKLGRGGSSSNWVTFKSENKWGAVLDGQGKTGFGWSIAAGSYIRIQNFEVKNMKYHGFHVSNSNIVTNVTYFGNKVHDIARRIISCSDSRVNIGHAGFYNPAGSKYMIYNSNIIYNVGRLPGGCSTQNDFSLDHGMYLHSLYTTIVNNVFYGNTSGWSIQMAGNYNTHTWKIINNTFHGQNPNKDGQIIIWDSAKSILIQNNTSYGARNFFIHSGLGDSDNTVTIKNNLVYLASVLSKTGSGYSLSGNITGQDPKFVDLKNRDFRLQSSSPAINKGLYTDGYNYDILGNSVVGYPDVGAYEYVGNADATAPSVPTNLTAKAVSSSQIDLAWTASTDNVGVAGYKVYRGGSLVATVSKTSYSDAGLTASTSYTYKVAAYDSAGNTSAQSSSASATTLSSSSSTTTTTTAVIVDNGKTGTSYNGTWKVSSAPNPYGTDSYWGRESSTYTWKASLTSGTYDVYMWWTAYKDRSTAAPVTITHSSGSQTVKVNQQINGGKWVLLGTYSFGSTGTVKIAGTGSTTVTVSADAVKFVKK
jgi:hypothetical protein